MLSNNSINNTESELALFKYSHLFDSRLAYFIVFIAGALLPLAFSPLNYYFLAVLSPAVFFYSLLLASPRRAAWLGWWFGMGFFSVGVSWVFVAIYVFGFSSVVTALLLTFISLNVLAVFISGL